MRCPDVPVSWGELIDKVTILEIKADRITRPEALANVAREHRLLSAIAGKLRGQADIPALTADLRTVNEQLWDVEDALREHEATGDFGSRFVELARSVYRLNDQRAAIKRRINLLLDSELCEEKSYADAGAKERPIFFQVA